MGRKGNASLHTLTGVKQYSISFIAALFICGRTKLHKQNFILSEKRQRALWGSVLTTRHQPPKKQGEKIQEKKLS